ncbi:thioesterase [Plantactinospora sp. KBS50]|nr:thioesterase [Plantactinospora sp. KBS50]
MAGSDRRYVHDCVLRWSDLDAYGHVNNARFLTLYEEARVAMLFAGGRAAGLDSFAAGMVIRRHEVDYLRPVDYPMSWPDPDRAPTVRIELWVEDLRAARLTIGYELFAPAPPTGAAGAAGSAGSAGSADPGLVLAGRARSVLVPYDLVRQAPRRLSAEERDFLSRYVVEPVRVDG